MQDIKKNYFIVFYKVGDWSIFLKTNVVYMYIQKQKYIPNKFKWFLIFMKVNGILNHVVSHSLNHVWIPCD
jgi:hypothetical protein